jgi:hypothetical protein
VHFAQSRCGFAIKEYFAARGRQHRAHEREERSLAAPAWTAKHDELAASDPQGD